MGEGTIREAYVKGAGGPQCEGQYVYLNESEDYTLAGDERVGPAVKVVAAFLGPNRCDLDDLTEAQQQAWWRKVR